VQNLGTLAISVTKLSLVEVIHFSRIDRDSKLNF